MGRSSLCLRFGTVAALTLRSAVIESARETLGWLRRERPGEGLRAGFSPAFEEDLLRGWRETRR